MRQQTFAVLFLPVMFNELLKLIHVVCHVLKEITLLENLQRRHVQILPASQVNVRNVAVATGSWELSVAKLLGDIWAVFKYLIVAVVLGLVGILALMW